MGCGGRAGGVCRAGLAVSVPGSPGGRVSVRDGGHGDWGPCLQVSLHNFYKYQMYKCRSMQTKLRDLLKPSVLGWKRNSD